VTRAGVPDGEVTEQFTAPVEVADQLSASDVAGGFEQVFDYGSAGVYEFSRDDECPCVCEFVGREAAPVTSVHARDGTLHVTVHVPEVADLRELVPALRERFGDVSVEYLIRSREDTEAADVVPVDLERLTDRQREVIETAYRLGYFEYPRETNASGVAAELGIEPSTLAEHLAAAQSKLLAAVLEGQG
jgi:predicted DNA binding protein